MIRIRARHPSGFEALLDVPSLEAVDGVVADLLAKGYRPPAVAMAG